jgi:hypothetical protein
MHSGTGIIVKHPDGKGNVFNILLGLMTADPEFSADGVVYGFASHAKTHLVNLIESVLPESVRVSAMFPQFTFDDNGNLSGEAELPYIVIQGIMGPSQEIGVGRILFDTPGGEVLAFNQTMYFKFDIFGRSTMKVDQILQQIIMLIQTEKSTNGYLWKRGFQNWVVENSDPGRGFRYDTAWDFRMQHQYASLFYSSLTLQTRFDVAWVDKTSFNGTIQQIIFQQTQDIPWSMIIGASMEYLRLEEIYWGWHGGTLL